MARGVPPGGSSFEFSATEAVWKVNNAWLDDELSAVIAWMLNSYVAPEARPVAVYDVALPLMSRV